MFETRRWWLAAISRLFRRDTFIQRLTSARQLTTYHDLVWVEQKITGNKKCVADLAYSPPGIAVLPFSKRNKRSLISVVVGMPLCWTRCLTLHLTISVKHWLVTDGRTDRQTTTTCTALDSIASHGKMVTCRNHAPFRSDYLIHRLEHRFRDNHACHDDCIL